jgi:hypothetical protein
MLAVPLHISLSVVASTNCITAQGEDALGLMLYRGPSLSVGLQVRNLADPGAGDLVPLGSEMVLYK